MKDRIKEVRKYNKETQLSFGEKLNVSKSTIEAIEYGRRETTDRMIADICRVYGVNETWLRTGTGEMFAPVDREQEIAAITARMMKENNPIRIQLEKIVSNLTEEQLLQIYEMAKQIVDAFEEEK